MVDKETKQEIRDEVNILGYAVRKTFFKFFVPILLVCVLLGGIGLEWRYVNVNAEREIFKQSMTYNEGVLDDLAKYKLEMIRAEDDIEKKAIAEMVVQRFANYDESKIETYDLKQFLKDCRNMNLEDY